MLNSMDLNLWMWIKDTELKEEKSMKKKNNIKSNDKKKVKKKVLELIIRPDYQLKNHNW